MELLNNNNKNNLNKEIEWSRVDEKIYYNLNLYNDGSTGATIDINFDLRRNKEIIEHPNEWLIGVENFSLDSYDIPIFISEENDPTYEVFIEDKSNGFVTSFNPDFFIINDNPRIRDYQVIIDAVNTAIREACDLQPAVDPPFLYLKDGDKIQIYLNADPNNDPPTQGTFFYNWITNPLLNQQSRYEISFNFKLAKLLNSINYKRIFDITYIVDNTYKQGNDIISWKFENDPTPAKNYLVLNQQWDPRPSMIQWEKIIFLTDLPIKNELVGEKDDVTRSQILDYIINDRLLDKKKINYFPNYIKWNNLLDARKINKISVSVVIQYLDGKIINARLADFSNFYMKLVFKRKEK